MSAIYQCGDATYTKHFAQDANGGWHYRIKPTGGVWGKWIPCIDKPIYAWYNPNAGTARIPS